MPISTGRCNPPGSIGGRQPALSGHAAAHGCTRRAQPQQAYSARNGGGYTLEAELGITPNGYSEPDFMGWEVKQYAVRDFTSFLPKGPVTLMTPVHVSDPDSSHVVAKISLPAAVWERLTAHLRGDDRFASGNPDLPDSPLDARIRDLAEMQVAEWMGSLADIDPLDDDEPF